MNISYNIGLHFLAALFISCTMTGRNENYPKVHEPYVKESVQSNINHPNVNSRAKQRTLPRKHDTNHIIPATEIFKRYNSAVFMIFTTDGYQAYQGSGFFISKNGLAVSNYHVFKGTTVGYEIIKLADGRQYKIDRVIAKSEADDYILFQIKGKFNYIPISQRQCEVGERVYTIGSPKGLENTFASGEISQIRNDDFIQISCPIDHGSSGGALINQYGEAIGITTGGHDDSGANLNFAKNIHVVPFKGSINECN